MDPANYSRPYGLSFFGNLGIRFFSFWQKAATHFTFPRHRMQTALIEKDKDKKKMTSAHAKLISYLKKL